MNKREITIEGITYTVSVVGGDDALDKACYELRKSLSGMKVREETKPKRKKKEDDDEQL
tara:strand:- start:91 stop:267 length:177 start_codon:yes stop_codon:yes gene_type:complete